MREIYRKQLVDPTYEFVTPLPPTASRVGGEASFKDGVLADDGAAASIGDLAPAGLRKRPTPKAD